MTFYLQDVGLINALGNGPEEVAHNLFAGKRAFVACDWVPGKTTYTAPVTAELLPIPAALAGFASRNLALAITAAEPLRSSIEALKTRFGPSRIAVVAGTSTSGIGEGEKAVDAFKHTGQRPPGYRYQQQEIGVLAENLASYFTVTGPAYTLSTACSSSAHALGSAYRLLAAGLVDAVIAGGADSLCKLTVNGFAALDSVDDKPCVPMSRHRGGINLGEAAAFFVVTREPGEEAIALLGVGGSSDAHHISAPDPAGAGARAAMLAGLKQAQVAPAEVGYINLHGTATPLNDAMESAAVAELFGTEVWCSSSKGQLGHTLGAAGATEAALGWLALSGYNPHRLLPPHCWDGERDPAIAALKLVDDSARWDEGRRILVSNSFAFGGNNAAVVMGDAP
ncbi:MAG TPA: beta-ketoacyl-ACP synthase [Marinobacter sp.]|nr:beta-ketoacyl-ACP synthase [Marinobacter sp.]